jgi:hypothetical protein
LVPAVYIPETFAATMLRPETWQALYILATKPSALWIEWNLPHDFARFRAKTKLAFWAGALSRYILPFGW